MAIIKMKKLRLIAPRELTGEILEKLMLLGCVELASQDFMFDDPSLAGLVKREYNDSTPFRTERQIYASAIKVLDRYVPAKIPLLSPKADMEQQRIVDESGDAEAKAIAKELTLLDEKLKNLKSDEVKEKLLVETLAPWKGCDIPLDSKGTKNTSLHMGTLPADCDMDALAEQLEEKAPESALFTVSSDENCIYLVMFCHKAVEEAALALMRERSFAVPAFGRARGLASKAINESMEYLDYIAGDRERTEARIRELAAHREALQLACDRADARVARSEAREKLLATNTATLYTAWFTAPEEAQLRELLDTWDCAYEITEPAEEEYPEVPVQLKNNAITDGLNMVTNMYALPQYGSVDPNPLMAPFFIMFFGIMMADMGYGLVMMLAGLLIMLKKRPKEGFMRWFGELMLEGGAATFIMGILTGGLFGDAPKWIVQLANPGSSWQGFPALIDPLNDTVTVLIGAIILGFIHLNAGMVIAFVMKARRGQLLDAICSEGSMWLLFIGAGLTVLGIGGKIGIIVGLVAYVLGKAIPAKGFGRVMAIFSGLYNDATGWFGDLLSYARLMALMLAGSVIAQVFNTLGAMPGNIIIFLVISLLGNTLNFGLNLLGCYVHDLRLQCLEFFGKFYEAGGRPFAPLKVKSRFYNVTK